MTYRNKILGTFAAAVVVAGVAGVPAQADAASSAQTSASARSTHPAKHGTRLGKEKRKGAAVSASTAPTERKAAAAASAASSERKAAAAASAGSTD